jgi:hypothetical protein
LWHAFFVVACSILAGAYLMLNQSAGPGATGPQPERREALTRFLLLVDVDGMRADHAFNPAVMPTLAELAARGASGIAETCQVTLSLPAIKAWTAGAGFAARDMVADFWSIDPSMDSIFRLAHGQGLSIAFAGPPEWIRSFGPFFDAAYTHGNAGHDTAANDEDTQGHARAYLRQGRFQVVAIHFIHSDMEGHMYGGRSPQYAAELHHIDNNIRELLSLAPPDATVLVIADHGTTDEGFHWTPAPDVVNAPFILSGKGVAHATGLHIKAVDIAPTLAALLGTGFPRQSVGHLVHAALAADDARKAQWEADYAVGRVRALAAASPFDTVARGELEAARSALGIGDFAGAIAAAQRTQAAANQRLSEMASDRSGRILLAIGLLGLAACFFLMHRLSRSDYANRVGPRPGHWWWCALGLAGICAVWAVNIAFQERLHDLILPFRSPTLIPHWKAIAGTLALLSIALAVLSRYARASLDRLPWAPVVLATGAAAMGSFGQIHDIVHWALVVLLGAWGVRTLLAGRFPLVPGLGVACLLCSLAARRIHTLSNALGPQGEAWSGAAAFAVLVASVVILTWALCLRKEDEIAPRSFGAHLRRLQPGVWMLWLLAALTLTARILGIQPADRILLAAIVLCLMVAVRSTRDEGEAYLAVCAAILGAFPLLYPAAYFPVLALLMIAGVIRSKRSAAGPGAYALGATALLGIFFLFFAFSGEMDLRVLDARRNLLLDPTFGFDYAGIARVSVLIVLQFVLPTFAVMAWLGFHLRADRAAWVRVTHLLHLFFLIQFLSLALYLQYKVHVLNSLFDHLSQLICMFAIYLGFHISTLVVDRIAWSRTREANVARAPQAAIA